MLHFLPRPGKWTPHSQPHSQSRGRHIHIQQLLVPTPQMATSFSHAPDKEKSTKRPPIKGAAKTFPRKSKQRREEISLGRAYQGAPITCQKKT